MWRGLTVCLAGAFLGGLSPTDWLGAAGRALAAEPPRTSGAVEHVAAKAKEPLATRFSLERAARSLDASALQWQKEHQCCQCHANFMYLVARPALAAIVPPAKEVRDLFEYLVRERWPTKGLRYP